jgi:phosphate transport system permease protein
MTPTPAKSFTGRTRRRTTSRGVVWSDRIARTLITVGGVGTIVAVILVCLFLVGVVVPMFAGNRVQSVAGGAALAEPPIHLSIDEYQNLAWAYFPSGQLQVIRLDDGRTIHQGKLFEATLPTCWTFALQNGDVAFGQGDGTVRIGRVHFDATFVQADGLPDALRALKPGQIADHAGGVVQATPGGQFRFQKLQVLLQDPLDLKTGSPIRLIDHTIRNNGPVLATVCDDGVFRIQQGTSKKNLLTGKATVTFDGGQLQLPRHHTGRMPRWLMLSGLGDNACVIWEDGQAIRLDTRDPANPKIAEQLDLVPEPQARVTASTLMIGRTTIVVGDSMGRVRCWFRIKPEGAPTIDGAVLTMAHDLPGLPDQAVTSLAVSSRTRKLAAGFADGSCRLYYVTAGRLLAQTPAAETPAQPVVAMTLSPKEDGLLSASPSRLARWAIDAPHPETNLAAILAPVWYEGYQKPEHVWQSSSGTDDFEPKFGLIPLIFGTLKATIYCMIFGVPVAMLAAIYSSEFLRPSTKAKVKPTIELMASLPSVVLGFLAALVFAPVIEGMVPTLLASFVTVPIAFLLGAYFWQMLPDYLAMRLQSLRLPAMVAAMGAGIAAAMALGPAVERMFFWVKRDGAVVPDLRAWLAGVPGADGTGGWMLMLLPACAVAVAILMGRLVTPRIRAVSADWSRGKLAQVDLLKFLCGAATTLAAALAMAKGLSLAGIDSRGGVIDTYVQRNALIVGFVMGFAVIPIIYTIAEDALSAVPEHLRAASLGAGATPWQTAVRIVIPTAMSGLFSAVMVGFGRAVGETMIVLMAAGNTPVMEWNIFNGFRTLSANIAVELPEAVRDSSHYRMLFLAALTLFIITFAINTMAESVRQRFRKRAYQL